MSEYSVVLRDVLIRGDLELPDGPAFLRDCTITGKLISSNYLDLNMEQCVVGEWLQVDAGGNEQRVVELGTNILEALVLGH